MFVKKERLLRNALREPIAHKVQFDAVLEIGLSSSEYK